jgi:hypothetical protein
MRKGATAALATAALTVLLGGAALADTAPNNCGDPSMVTGVQFLSLQSAQNLTLVAQADGTFTADVQVRVFCKRGSVDIGDVAGSKIQVSTTVPNTSINGVDASSPVTIDVPTGLTTVHISSTNPGLAAHQWFARVGSDTTFVSIAFDRSVSFDDSPVQIGRVFAQTPELDSLVLFGAGAVGMGGYALSRLRARRRS